MALTERFTYAELDYLLATHPAWIHRREELGFPDPGDGEATTTAGLASLIVRGFVGMSSDGVTVEDRILVLSQALAEATSFVFLSRADDADLSADMVSVDARPMVVSLIAPGCVELLALDPDRPREELVTAMVLAASGEGEVLGLAAPGETAILIGRMDDQWLLGGDPEKGDPAVVDEATVRAAVARIVERAQAAGSAPPTI